MANRAYGARSRHRLRIRDLIVPMIRRLRRSPLIGIAERVGHFKQRHADLIDLAMGEPDCPPPKLAKAAAVRAIVQDQSRYTPSTGTLEVRQAVVQRLRRLDGLKYSIDEVITSAGGLQVLSNAMRATLVRGAEVIIPTPFWAPYADVVRLAGGTARYVSCSQRDGFRLDPAALEAALSPRTRWLILNSPSNPTGSVLHPDNLLQISRVLRKHPQVWILSDDIYSNLVYGSAPYRNIVQVASELRERTLILNGASKAYAMPGWRFGFAAGPRELIRAMTIVQEGTTLAPCTISQAAAVKALSAAGDGFIRRLRRDYRRRRDLFVARLSRIAGFDCAVPAGSFYLFPQVAGLIGRRTSRGTTLRTDSDVADYLLSSAHVAVMPGAIFGASPYLRLSFATTPRLIGAACARIDAACAALR